MGSKHFHVEGREGVGLLWGQGLGASSCPLAVQQRPHGTENIRCSTLLTVPRGQTVPWGGQDARGRVGFRPCGDGRGQPSTALCSYLKMARWVCSCSSPLMTQEKSPKDSAPMDEGDWLGRKVPALVEFGGAGRELSVLTP